MIPTAKEILTLVRGADDERAAALIEQYAKTVASIAVVHTAEKMGQIALDIFAPERGTIQ